MQDDSVQPPRRFRSFVLTVILVAIAFGAGYIPKELEVRRLRESLKQTEINLQLADLHRQLGVASHEALRNNYPAAAGNARVFFKKCQMLAQEQRLTAEPRTLNALAAYSGEADKLLPLLAAGDPAAREQLAGMFLALQGVLQRRL